MFATRLQVAAYIGKSMVSRAIQWFTRAGWQGPSHVAIRDSQSGRVWEAWEGAGVRVLSHLGEGHTPGTRVDLFNWILSDADVERVLAFCDGECGKKYDLLGILGFVTKRPRDNGNRWFCSELVVAASQLTKNPLLERTCPRNVAPVHVCWSPVLWFQQSVQVHEGGQTVLPWVKPFYDRGVIGRRDRNEALGGAGQPVGQATKAHPFPGAPLTIEASNRLPAFLE
jgi:hypothetical protein